MTNLKAIDFSIQRHLSYNDTILLRTGEYIYELSPAEILGLVTVLSQLTNELLEELLITYIKDTHETH